MKFELNELEEKRFNKFKKHHCKLKGKTGAIAGQLQVVFTITGLGLFAEAKCGCGKIKDLTDYDMV